MHKSQANGERAKEALKFFDWAYRNGDSMALELDYIPMPDAVVKLVQSTWHSQIKDSGGNPVW